MVHDKHIECLWNTGLSDATLQDEDIIIIQPKLTGSSKQYTLKIYKVIKDPQTILISKFSPKLSFSPESGGSVKPRTAMDAIRRQGTIRLKK